jgi:hypothetical protein
MMDDDDIRIDSALLWDRVALLAHHKFADIIDADLGILDEARLWLVQANVGGRGTQGTSDWQMVLKMPWLWARKTMLSRCPRGRLLRSNSPVTAVIGLRDAAERDELWAQARAELIAEFSGPILDYQASGLAGGAILPCGRPVFTPGSYGDQTMMEWPEGTKQLFDTSTALAVQLVATYQHDLIKARSR